MATQQMSLQPLVCEESVLTFLTVEWGAVVDHLGMNFDLENYFHEFPIKNEIIKALHDIDVYFTLCIHCI